MSQAQNIRSEILGAKPKSVEFTYNGKELIVTELTIADYDNLQDRCKGSDGELNVAKYTVQSVISQCKHKEDGKPVFGRADAEALMNQPLNSGFLKAFREAQEKLMEDEEVPLAE